MDNVRRFYDIMVRCRMPVMPLDEWLAYAKDNTELWPIVKHGVMVGGIFFKGHTIHIAVLPEWHGRWFTPSILKGWRQFGHAADLYATPAANNKPACDMVERLGFKLVRTEGQFNIYVKEKPCPQQSSSP